MATTRTSLYTWGCRAVCACAVIIGLAAAAPGASASVPPNFDDQFLRPWGNPTGLAFTNDGRLLFTTQTGQVWVWQNDQLVVPAALDLTGSVCTEIERGLQSVAVDPEFATNHFIYLYYTFRGDTNCGTGVGESPENRVSRFVLEDDNTVDPSTETVLIDGIPSTASIHNGGDLHFGKDAHLYVSTGDGGCDWSPAERGCGPVNPTSRDPNVLAGKVLRITAAGDVPQDNPYLGAGTARCNVTGRTTAGTWCREIYATGLRNPFRLAFDPNAADTRFFINDVGLDAWEEINLGQAAADYGWNLREGPCMWGTSNCGPPPVGLTDPLFAYDHSDGCSAITGGAFVPEGVWPSEYDGDRSYMFGDFVCGKMWQLVPDGAGGYQRLDFGADLGNIVAMAFGPGAGGTALYYLTSGDIPGLHRITYTGGANRSPKAIATATPDSGDAPLEVTFDASASYDPDDDTLTFDWDFGDGSPHASTAVATHTYAGSQTYYAQVTVSDGQGGAATKTLRVDPGDRPPVPSIDAPVAGHLFSVGETLTLSGGASDHEDGALPDSSLSWRVIKHHATHSHPYLPPTTGNDIEITAPAPEDFSATTNSYLEVFLTATDSRGVTRTVSREVHPRTVDVTFATFPTGLQLELNGYPAPASVTSWEGWALAVNAPSPQVDSMGQTVNFLYWSDGGAQAHSFITPAADTTLTALFGSLSYARPKGAASVRMALVPAYHDCGGGTHAHAPPLSHPSCAPPVPHSGYLTIGTPDANLFPAASNSYAIYQVLLGNPATPADEADVRLRTAVTDVRDRTTLTDYLGELEVVVDLRLTDRNSTAQSPATVLDFPFRFPVQCSPTLGTAGSDCSLDTTADAVVPGLVREGARAIWQLAEVRVFDGGPDGFAETADNTLFAVQGIFVP